MYYHYDALGNVMDLTDHLGQGVVKYRWDAFGGMFAGTLAPYSRMGLTGKEYDQKTDLVFFGSRWYDPLAGRFTMPDSFMGRIAWPSTLNTYAYAMNNPVRYLDPTGHDVGWGSGGGNPYDAGDSSGGSSGGGDSSGDSSGNNSDDSSNTDTSNDTDTSTGTDTSTSTGNTGTSTSTGNTGTGTTTGNTGTGNTTSGGGSGTGSSSGSGGGGGGSSPPPQPPEGGDVQVQQVEPNTIGANQPVTGYTFTEANTPQDVLPPDINRPESYATFGQIANVTLNATARVLEAYMDVSSLGMSAAARSSIRQLITSEAGWVRFGREAGKAADEVINTAEGAGKAAAQFGKLEYLGNGTWQSSQGLIYGQGSAQGNRILHVLEHAVPNTNKANHTVFNVARDRILPLVDEAWSMRGNPLANDPGAYVIPMGRVVGTNGETAVKLIVRPGTSEVITAYPVIP